MRKFIATLAATALAFAGAVVAAPSSSAEVNLEILATENGVTFATPLPPGSVLAMSREKTRTFNGEPLINCGISAAPQEDVASRFDSYELWKVARAYADEQKGDCSRVLLSVVEHNAELTELFNGINFFAGQTFGLKYRGGEYPVGKGVYIQHVWNEFAGKATLYMREKNYSTYNFDLYDCREAGRQWLADEEPEWDITGQVEPVPDNPTLCDVKLMPLPGKRVEGREVCSVISTAGLTEDQAKREARMDCGTQNYTSVIEGGYTDGDEYVYEDCTDDECKGLGYPPPEVDADCADDEMVVPTKHSGNVCHRIPSEGTAQGGDNGAFNTEFGNGYQTSWETIEVCRTSYIGNYMKIADGTPYQDWFRENMIYDHYQNGDYDDCIQRAVDVTGSRDSVGLRSSTTYLPDVRFFTDPVEGEPLCDIQPLEKDNRHAEHCATTVTFWETLTTALDPDVFPDFGFLPGVDPNPEVSVELPDVPDSLDYEFVYEQGEAGVCLYDGEETFTQNGKTFCGTPVENPIDVEPIQDWTPPPPECWQGPNNCPVGQSISYAVPKYMMVGVPVNVTVYATRTVEDELGRFNYGLPDNGTAVIHYGDPDSPPVAGVPFINGEATFRVVPQEAGDKNFSICGVLGSNLSGGNAYIECIDGQTTVLPYDPEKYRKAFKDLVFSKGDTFVVADKDQMKGKIAKRLEWRAAQSDEDVCAVYETKKGKVKAKFSKTGECTVIWTDPKTGESGKIQLGS